MRALSLPARARPRAEQQLVARARAARHSRQHDDVRAE